MKSDRLSVGERTAIAVRQWIYLMTFTLWVEPSL